VGQLQLELDSELNKKCFKLFNLDDIKSGEKRYKVLELFSGAGGMALGLHKAGLDPIALIDIDKDANSTVKHNFPNWNVLEKDINEIAEEGIDSTIDNKKSIDIITGGFPCQPFSYAGKRAGLDDTRGTVFYSLAKIIKEVMPKMFVLENVKGLLNHDKGKTFEVVFNILNTMNYDIDYRVLNAWDYNVPQKRERVFIIGIQKSLNTAFEWPNQYLNKPVLSDVLFNVPSSEGSKYPENKKKVLELVPSGGCWVDLPDEVAREYMGKSYFSGGGRRGMARRLSYEEPSLTLTTSPAQKQTERCHPSETRPFNIREYARIQTFPDDYKFMGSISAAYRQIGNAVPVNLAYEIGKSIVKTLDKIVEEEKE